MVRWQVLKVGDVLGQVLVTRGVRGTAAVLKVDSAGVEGTGGVRGHHRVSGVLPHGLVLLSGGGLTWWSLDFGVNLAWRALAVRILAHLADVEVVLVTAHLVSDGLSFF